MPRDDRLSPLTRAAFTPLAVLTAVFGPALLLFPGSTDEFWAWELRPDMSAVWLGAGYTFGAMSITSMLVAGRWSKAAVAVIGTTPFAMLMLAATVLHWDRFFTDSARFYIWLAVYAGLPVLLPVIWLVNRRRDPGPRDGEALLSRRLRLALVAAGAAMALLAAWIFLDPDAAASVWPWTLRPLAARVVAGWLAFLAAGALCATFEPRYAAYNPYLLPAAAWFGLLLLASLLNLDDFDRDAPATYLYFAAVALAAVAPLAIRARVSSRLATPT